MNFDNVNKESLTKKMLFAFLVISTILYFFIQDKLTLEETVFLETSPNKDFSIEIKSGTYNNLGQGIIIYTKNNQSKSSDFKELTRFNISSLVDSKSIHHDFDDDKALIKIIGDMDVLNLEIWLNEKTKKFEYNFTNL